MANLRGPSRPMDPTAQDKTKASGPPTGSPQTMGPPASIRYHGAPHNAQVGQHVKVTIHGKVAAHTMGGKVEGGQPGTGSTPSTLDIGAHKMTVEPMQGEPEGSQEPGGDNLREEAAEGGMKVGAAPNTGRPAASGGGGTMVDAINRKRMKYKPLRGTAGPMSGAAS